MIKHLIIRYLDILYDDIFKPTKYWIKYIKMRLLYRVKIMNSFKTIDFIKKHKCSISRYGDGEIALLLGEWDCNFQKRDKLLQTKLEKTMLSTEESLLICLPKYYNHVFNAKRASRKIWRDMCINNGRQESIVKMLRKYKGRKYVYGDSFITRPYIDMKSSKLADKVFPKLKSLWNDNDLMIIEGELTRLGIGNDLFDNVKSIKRILAPAENAFDVYDEIIESVKKHYCNELILIALGPTATVMAYDLSKLGMWAIDIGHVDIEYEWYIQGAKDKCAIKGKYTNEAVNGRIVEDIIDEKYDSQIVDRIGC